MTEQAPDLQANAPAYNGPRVLPTEIDALMARVQYIANLRPAGTTSTFVHAFLDGDFLLATGHSACVDPGNFVAARGIEIATNDAQAQARKKLWELEGYALRQRLIKAKTMAAEFAPSPKEEVLQHTEDPDHGTEETDCRDLAN